MDTLDQGARDVLMDIMEIHLLKMENAFPVIAIHLGVKLINVKLLQGNVIVCLD
jgi:hypothetical protein